MLTAFTVRTGRKNCEKKKIIRLSSLLKIVWLDVKNFDSQVIITYRLVSRDAGTFFSRRL